MSGTDRRYLIRDHVEAVDPELEWPEVIRLLHPTSVLDIWGRASDGWRLVGAHEADEEYVLSAVHFLSDASRMEIAVDTATGVPIRWTTTLVLEATTEIVLTDVEVHGSRPERIISVATDPGVMMAFPSAVDDEPRWWRTKIDLMHTDDLERLQRWEDAGAQWEVVSLRADTATISLLRCDGGEEVDRFVTADPLVLALCRARR